MGQDRSGLNDPVARLFALARLVLAQECLDLNLGIIREDFDIVRKKGTGKQNAQSSKKIIRLVQVMKQV